MFLFSEEYVSRGIYYLYEPFPTLEKEALVKQTNTEFKTKS